MIPKKKKLQKLLQPSQSVHHVSYVFDDFDGSNHGLNGKTHLNTMNTMDNSHRNPYVKPVRCRFNPVTKPALLETLHPAHGAVQH